MSGRTLRIRWRAAVGVTGAVTALAVGLPQSGCAEQPSDTGVVLRGDPARTVHFEPSYGDLAVTTAGDSGTSSGR